jgi:hypothetical protein
MENDKLKDLTEFDDEAEATGERKLRDKVLRLCHPGVFGKPGKKYSCLPPCFLLLFFALCAVAVYPLRFFLDK